MSEQTQATRPLFDLDAEQATLGAMLLSRDVIAEVEGIVTAEAFYRPNHVTIYARIVALAAAGGPVDPIAVTSSLAESGDLARVGGAPYLHDLTTKVPTPANGAHYARTVAERALLREIDQRGRMILRLVQEGDGAASELLDRAQQILADVEPGNAGEGMPAAWAQIVPEVMDAIDKAASLPDATPGVPTGIVDLDQLLKGLHPGQLIVVAGRTGVGKSVALTGVAQHAAWRCKLPTLLFSLEMDRVEMGMRMMSAATRVPLDDLRSGRLADDGWARVARVAGETEDAPLWIDQTANLTLADIRNLARRHTRRHGQLSLIAVDYLQLIGAGRTESRQVAVAELSRGLKLLAKELGVPVVVAAQLNRGPESRADKRPLLSDLRESGAIEQDADVVILVHREDYYDKESPRAGEADFIVAKHRGGPTDTITVAAQLHYSRFVDMAMG